MAELRGSLCSPALCLHYLNMLRFADKKVERGEKTSLVLKSRGCLEEMGGRRSVSLKMFTVVIVCIVSEPCSIEERPRCAFLLSMSQAWLLFTF